MRKQNFIIGAVILMTANAVSKILGAVFKIPLTYILNEEGMAVYNTAFQVYIMFLSFIISGFPTAISKTVAESMSFGKPSRARRCTCLLTLILSAAGLIGSALLYFFAPYFASALKEENAAAAIRVISPSVFFVALGTGYKSYFQGVSDMLPVAVSQVIESVIKLVVGCALAMYCVKFGMNATVSGAISGVTVGEILATFMLFIGYIVSKKPKNALTTYASDDKAILRSVFVIAVPLLFAAAASNAVSLAETAVVRNHLLDAGLGEDEARFLYGAYTGYALTVFHLPSGILGTLGISILPVIAGAMAVNNKKRARSVTATALNLTLILSLPCAAVMYMLPEELLNSLFRNASSALMLKIIAPSIVPVCLTQIMVSVMQSGGKVTEPFLLMFASSAVKIALCFALIPMYDIYGLAISSAVSSFLLLALEWGALKRFLGVKLGAVQTILKPFLAGAVMVFLIYALKDGVCANFGGGLTAFAVIAALSLAGYALTLLLTGGVKIKELRRII
ncbi:MAG: polysaccharide biosynthesis protein [Firmicutes bacterium]|nr:polysaccharide biosynthesis protein [Bacillota bacterium]